VLHHAGPLAGAALFAGLGGSLIFFALGLLVSIPFLRRLHRRYAGWRAPALAIVAFTVVFAFSALVVSPRITAGDGGGSAKPTPSSAPSSSEHKAHHE
jgi:Kef-type K+ transport system membrane component KefB